MKVVAETHPLVSVHGVSMEGAHANFDFINAPAPRNKPRLFKQRRRDANAARAFGNA